MNKFKKVSAIFALSLLVLVACQRAHATSIQQLSFEQLVAQAALVFEGQVISSEARWNDARTEIYTAVEFRINEVIKGQVSGDSLKLTFAGGQIERDSFVVQALVYPSVGETGIYFVERTDIDMMNPLLGWSQGHFITDGNQLMTNQNKRVVEINAEPANESDELSLSHGEIKGLRTSKTDDLAGASGVSVGEFKQLIVDRLQ